MGKTHTVADSADSSSIFEQRRKLRRVRMIVDLTSSLISNDSSLSYREARSLVDCAEKAIVELVPGYHHTFAHTVKPRLDGIIRRRWPAAAHWSQTTVELVN